MTHKEFEKAVKDGKVQKLGFIGGPNENAVKMVKKRVVELVQHGDYDLMGKAQWSNIVSLRGAKIYTEQVGNVKVILVWFVDTKNIGIYAIT